MTQRRCYGCMQMITEDICPHCGAAGYEDNATDQLPVGTMLRERYLMGRVLGQGGFGITYIGLDTQKDEIVAIKEFFPRAMVNRNISRSTMVQVNLPKLEESFAYGRDRFLREARILEKFLEIPEIVDIRDLFSENDTAYIVMEYVRGIDLREYIDRRGGKLSVEETLKLLEPIAYALDMIHQEGLIHRDVSPDNIMLQPRGRAKLLDFGASRDAGSSDADKDLTHSTETILKHGFAPMEQYNRRGNLGPWTDEYSFCATVYYCLTGEVPPEAPSRIIEEESIGWDKIPGLNQRQREALEKGMAIRAKERFGSMEKLHRALYAPELRGNPDPKPEEKDEKKDKKKDRKKKSVLPALLGTAAVLVACLGIFFGIRLMRAGAESAHANQLLQTAPSTQAETVEATEPTAATQIPATTAPVQTEPVETQPPETIPPETVPKETEPLPPPDALWGNNVLASSPFEKLGIGKDQVKTVSFRDTLNKAPDTALDVSHDGDGSVKAWNVNGNVTFAGEGGINGAKAAASLFNSCRNLTAVTFAGAFHTDTATDLSEMFANCGSLKSVDVATLNVANAKSMERMFFNCSTISWLDVNSWDVSRVRDMSAIFSGCHSLINLYVSNWDVSGVEEMDSMFSYCRSLRTLNVRTWDVSGAKNMQAMFAYCDVLNGLEVSQWDVSSVTNMGNMFEFSEALAKLEVGSWDVSSVTNMGYMFHNCLDLKNPDVSNWDVSSVVNMNSMFDNCEVLSKLDVSGWDVSSVTDMGSLFSGCLYLNGLDVSGWDVSGVKNMSYMFYNCGYLKALDVSNWDVSSVMDMESMFTFCGVLKKLEVGNWDVSKVTDMRGMFSYCEVLSKLDVSNWDVSQVTNMSAMFNHCRTLNELAVAEWNVSKVTDMSSMFYCCYTLQVLDVSRWDVSSVWNMRRMFMHTNAIRDLNTSEWDVSGVSNYDEFMNLGKSVNGKPWKDMFTKVAQTITADAPAQPQSTEAAE